MEFIDQFPDAIWLSTASSWFFQVRFPIVQLYKVIYFDVHRLETIIVVTCCVYLLPLRSAATTVSWFAWSQLAVFHFLSRCWFMLHLCYVDLLNTTQRRHDVLKLRHNTLGLSSFLLILFSLHAPWSSSSRLGAKLLIEQVTSLFYAWILRLIATPFLTNDIVLWSQCSFLFTSRFLLSGWFFCGEHQSDWMSPSVGQILLRRRSKSEITMKK